jgi:hypothetical protein
MNTDRYYHTATTLADGASVLVVGGSNGTAVLSGIQLYNSADFKVRPLAWSFGDTKVDTQQTHSFTVTNGLPNQLTLTVGFSGPDAAMFSASGCSTLPASGSCTVTVTFKPTSTGNKEALLTITDATATSETVAAVLTGTGTSDFQVTVNAIGNGSGTVTSTPAGLDCSLSSGNPSCSANLPSGQITLVAAPTAPVSYFSGWSGPVGCSGNTCSFNLTEAATVTAGFYLYPVTIGKTTYYATLQDAYDVAASGSQILVAGSYNVSQSVNLGRNIPVVVKGGYDGGFGSATGYSTIGPLTVGMGSAVVDRLTIY